MTAGQYRPLPGPDTRQRAEAYITDALGEWADAHDIPSIVDELRDRLGTWDLSQTTAAGVDFWAVVQQHAHDDEQRPHSAPDPVPGHVPGQLPLLDSASAVRAEIRWVAAEARALLGSTDEPRRARFYARKRALLAYIDRAHDHDHPSGATAPGGGDA